MCMQRMMHFYVQDVSDLIWWYNCKRDESAQVSLRAEQKVSFWNKLIVYLRKYKNLVN